MDWVRPPMQRVGPRHPGVSDHGLLLRYRGLLHPSQIVAELRRLQAPDRVDQPGYSWRPTTPRSAPSPTSTAEPGPGSRSRMKRKWPVWELQHHLLAFGLGPTLARDVVPDADDPAGHRGQRSRPTSGGHGARSVISGRLVGRGDDERVRLRPASYSAKLSTSQPKSCGTGGELVVAVSMPARLPRSGTISDVARATPPVIPRARPGRRGCPGRTRRGRRRRPVGQPPAGLATPGASTLLHRLVSPADWVGPRRGSS